LRSPTADEQDGELTGGGNDGSFISTLPPTYLHSHPFRDMSLAAPNGAKMSCAAYQRAPSLSVLSDDLLAPFPPPPLLLEGTRELLCLVHELAVAEFDNAHCVCWSSLVRDCYSVIQRSPFPRIRLTLKPDGFPG